MLTGLTDGFGKQREVHEDAKTDRRFHGAAEWNQPDAFKM